MKSVDELTDEQLRHIADSKDTGTCRARIRDAITASPASAAEPVEIKQLEWVKHPSVDAWRAETLLGTYQVWAGAKAGPSWIFDAYRPGDGTPECPADNAVDAKAASQADFEARIRSTHLTIDTR